MFGTHRTVRRRFLLQSFAGMAERARAAQSIPSLSPPLTWRLDFASPHPLRGALARRLEKRDGVRRPRVWFAARHSGGVGAPSGATKSPCQELADVLTLRYRPPAYLSAASNPESRARRRTDVANKHARDASCVTRMWRAERRQRALARSANHTDCAFRRATPQNPDAIRAAARRTHAYVPETMQQTPAFPLGGEGKRSSCRE
jgi:hypothetical protein